VLETNQFLRAAYKHESVRRLVLKQLPDYDDLDDIEVELYTRDENDEIAKYIIELLQNHQVLHWRELMKLVRDRYTVSVERLQNILRDLVYDGRVVELPCRFFTLHEIWQRLDVLTIVNMIEKKVQILGLSRCSPPLASAKHPIKLRISRSSNKENKLTILQINDVYDLYTAL